MSSLPLAQPKPSSGLLDRVLTPGPLPLIMGVVNATSDSFYAASRARTERAVLDRALQLAEQGADIIDIGGQSTRPGSDPVSESEELDRTVAAIEAFVRNSKIPVSIDTDKAAVARACRKAGARMLNDVSALRNDPLMLKEAVEFEAVVLMHLGGGSPKTMQKKPVYADVVKEVKNFLSERIETFVKAGGDRSRALVDPGIGFGKDLDHNLSLLKHLSEFSKLAPVVLGASRKSFLGRVTPDAGPDERLAGSLASALWGAEHGARIVRVHDVGDTQRALQALAAIRSAK